MPTPAHIELYNVQVVIPVAHVVGHKGQVVIAKEIRDSLGIGPGWVALQRVVDDHVEIRSSHLNIESR